MEQKEYLPNIIGQNSVKNRLRIYKQSYSKTGRLPFILFTASRGSGKTKFIREFRSTLKNQNGDTPPIMEVNAAAIKNADSFFDQIYPVWTNNNAVLFLDECHELPDKLCQIFLSILDKDPNPVRRVTYEHREMGPVDYDFDFRKIGIVMATTDAQKLPAPLLDRLTEISIGSYSEDDLFKIFQKNLNCNVSEHITRKIKSVFRGHPRACVELAEELDHYADAHSLTYINREHFDDFCNVMGIHPFGLNNAEMQIIKVLGERGSCSLNSISAATGYSKSVIQQKYEYSLLHKGLIDIDGKRMLSSKGRELYLSEFASVDDNDAAPTPTSVAPKRTAEVERVLATAKEINNTHPLYK